MQVVACVRFVFVPEGYSSVWMCCLFNHFHVEGCQFLAIMTKDAINICVHVLE